jgi:hypothetical protein
MAIGQTYRKILILNGPVFRAQVTGLIIRTITAAIPAKTSRTTWARGSAYDAQTAHPDPET